MRSLFIGLYLHSPAPLTILVFLLTQLGDKLLYRTPTQSINMLTTCVELPLKPLTKI